MEMKRTVEAKRNAMHVNSERHNNRNNNQTDTLKETNKKGDVSVKKGEGIEKEG